MELPDSSQSYNGNDSTVVSPSLPLEFLLAYYFTFLIIIIPVIVLDALIILALLVDRTTVGIIRLVLCNIPAACLVVAITVLAYDVVGIGLAFTDIRQPERVTPFCRAILYFVGVGGAARFLSLATFSVTVYYIVRFHKGSKKKSNQHALIGFALAVIVLWVAAFLSKLPVFFDPIIDNSCRYTVLGGSINVALFILVFVIGGFATCITFLFLTAFYIRQHSISNGSFKKTMLKFGFFLLIENCICFIGQILPVITALAVSSGEASVAVAIVIYLAAMLIDLSLIPTPILLIIYFKPVRTQLKRWFCCGKESPQLERRSTMKSTTKSSS